MHDWLLKYIINHPKMNNEVVLKKTTAKPQNVIVSSGGGLHNKERAEKNLHA